MAHLTNRRRHRKGRKAAAEPAAVQTELFPDTPILSQRDRATVREFIAAVRRHFGPPESIRIRQARWRTHSAVYPEPAPGDATVKKSEAFPSRFFRAADLIKPLVVEIESVTREMLEDLKGVTKRKTVLHFVGHDRGLVLNSTNWDSIVDITGEDDDARWPGHSIELYKDRTAVGGRTVDCTRIRAPQTTKHASITTSARRMKEIAVDEGDMPPFDPAE